MKPIGLLKSLCLAGGLGLAGLACTALPATAKTLRMVSAYPDSNFHTQNIRHFAELLDAGSGGGLSVKLFANSAIYKAPEILGAVGQGEVPLGEIFLSAYANEDPLFGADAVAYLISGYAGAKALDTAMRPLLEKHLEARGVKLLYTVPWPPAGFYATRRIDTAADLSGMKIRSASPITKQWTDRFGMQTVVIQVPELAQAFATGAVDSMFTASALAPSIQAWDFTHYFYDLQAVLTRNAVVMNINDFKTLSPEDQAALMAAAGQAEADGWAASQAADAAAKALMVQHGMQVLPPSPELEAAMKAAGREVAAAWLATLPEDSRAVLAEFVK